MSCYEWSGLLAHRFDPSLEAPERWSESEAHLEECADCRRAALAVDPTLAFKGAAAWTSTAEESASILQAVRTLRRAADLERRAFAGRADKPRRRISSGTRARDRGPLVAAALFALVLALQPSTTVHNEVDQGTNQDRSQETSQGASRGTLVQPAPTAQLLPAARPAAPAIEGVDRPGARVYEWGADDLSVVMVVDESLDV